MAKSYSRPRIPKDIKKKIIPLYKKLKSIEKVGQNLKIDPTSVSGHLKINKVEIFGHILPKSIQDILLDLYTSGLGPNEISIKLGIAWGTVAKYLEIKGIKLKKNNKVTEVQGKQIIELYKKTENSAIVAKKLNLNKNTVSAYLDRTQARVNHKKGRDKMEKEDNLRLCHKCGEIKTLDCFGVSKMKGGPKTYRRRSCKDCDIIKCRRSHLLKYGLTEDKYNEMLLNQNGRCEVCGQKETSVSNMNGKVRHLTVDHDHSTEKVRGLLCNRCNTSIGKFNDDIKLIEKVLMYLKKYRHIHGTQGPRQHGRC